MRTTKSPLHLVSSETQKAAAGAPSLRDFLQHIDALQVLALRRPKAAKAILRFTEALAKKIGPR
jgi:hypothetical protein